ncbi:hypothetical protein [Nocardia sp. NPDC003963]
MSATAAVSVAGLTTSIGTVMAEATSAVVVPAAVMSDSQSIHISRS